MSDLYAVFGNPVAHSKSPWIHQQFAQATAQAMHYETRAPALEQFAQGLDLFRAEGGVGANVTVPFKQEAFALCQQRSARAERAGAVNTLYWQGDVLCGDNTDGAGLLRDLEVNQGLRLAGLKVLILGAGGAVRGILQPLLDAGVAQIFIANRSPDKARALAELFDHPEARVMAGSWADAPVGCQLIINGTSASLQGEVPPLAEAVWVGVQLAYDMMYGATPTAFLQAAAHHQVPQRVDGLGMLVEQAAEAFYVWRGVRPPASAVLNQLRTRL